MFQAALVSIHNAKSDNQSVQQQGIHNLTQCAELHAKENAFSTSRIAGLLRKLAARYSVFNDPRHNNNNNDVILFCPTHAAHDTASPGNNSSSTTTTPSSTADNASTQNNEQPPFSDIHHDATDQQDTMSPMSLLNNDLQFDLASLTSDMPLWNAPSGVTWTDWDPFLQQPSL